MLARALGMTMYCLYVRDLNAGDLVWFTVDKSLAPGRYVRDRNRTSSPEVYISESIPALIFQVAPLLQQAEQHVQSALGPDDLSASAKQRIANEMTEGLLERLTATSSIWVADPDWVDELHPFIEAGS